MNQERFYKFGEVQRMMGVSRSTLWRWTAEHGLKVVRVGSVARIRESDLQAFLQRHETCDAQNKGFQSNMVQPGCGRSVV